MKKFIAVAAAALISAAAWAGETAVIDASRGGLRATLKSEMDGPYDFGRKPGPRVLDRKDIRLIAGEAMFNGKASETATLVIQLLVGARTEVRKGDTPLTADHMANEMLSTNGFDLSRAEKIDGPTPPNLPPGAEFVTYKAVGHPVFDKVKTTKKDAMIVQGVSYPGKTKGYAIMSTVMETDVKAFDADPEKYVKHAKAGFVPLFKNLTVTEN